MTYSDLVTFLLDTASGLTYSGNTSGLTIQNAEFGPNFNLGLNSNTTYPLFYLTPTKSTIGKESITSYSFQIIILDKILTSNNRSDRALKYSIIFEWLVAYFQYLDQILQVDYNISNDPIETNYDQLATGWVGEITIYDSYECILTSSGRMPAGSNLPNYGIMGGTSGVDGSSGSSGTSGSSGSSGVDGSSGSSGSSGVDGISDIVNDTTPQLGGNLSLNGKGIIIESQTIDGGVFTGNLVYIDTSTNTWKQADADQESTCSTTLGIYLGSNQVLLWGIYTTTGLSTGIQYASTTNGTYSTTKPSGTGDIVRIVGEAISSTILFFFPDRTYIEI